jgi:hypothetical protein
MKSIGILPLAIVLATPCIIAQDIVLHPSPNIVSRRSPLLTSRADCPVGLRVNHGSSFLVREAEYGPFAAPPRPVQVQRIQLTMTNLSSQEIVKAQITVHGLSDKWRYVPLPEAPAPDLTKRVEVALEVRGNSHASSDLSLSRFTSVTSVDLNSLTYADGATWEASSPTACSVVPDPFMLVTAVR